MDIMATCADILNIALPDGTAEDSISFYPLLKNPKLPVNGLEAASQPRGLRDSLIHHAYDGMYSVRKGEWKYIEGLGSGGFSEPRRYTAEDGDAAGQLYNIADDSRETLNLWLTRQDKAKELQTILRSSGV
jgi:arylsulfatase A